MNESFVKNRITELRLQNNLSEYQLSLSIGHSKGYIQSITSGRNMPSLTALFEICDYFNITLSEFFDSDLTTDTLPLYHDIVTDIKNLSANDLFLLSMLLKRLLNSSQ